jgi:hypothetical protein
MMYFGAGPAITEAPRQRMDVAVRRRRDTWDVFMVFQRLVSEFYLVYTIGAIVLKLGANRGIFYSL